MTIHCRVCGEPYDQDEIHELAKECGISWKEAWKMWTEEGCKAFIGGTHSSIRNTDAALKASVLQDLLGDDVDAIAALEEDL